MKNYYDVQKRNLENDDANAWSRTKEVELMVKEVELNVLARSKVVALKQ
jgi:hypothetical protein